MLNVTCKHKWRVRLHGCLPDIGDDQSIVQSLSTFSAHVARMRRIMSEASAHPHTSLVLLDEIGSGTDPTEGSAIGMAVLRQVGLHLVVTVSCSSTFLSFRRRYLWSFCHCDSLGVAPTPPIAMAVNSSFSAPSPLHHRSLSTPSPHSLLIFYIPSCLCLLSFYSLWPFFFSSSPHFILNCSPSFSPSFSSLSRHLLVTLFISAFVCSCLWREGEGWILWV